MKDQTRICITRLHGHG